MSEIQERQNQRIIDYAEANFSKTTQYMATVVATRFEPLIRDFYQRLLSKGKPYKVAVTACMRKLLTILNARMRDYFAENGITENSIRTA